MNLLVVRARQHRVPKIATAVEQLTKSGLPVDGGILNDARAAGGYDPIYARVASGA